MGPRGEPPGLDGLDRGSVRRHSRRGTGTWSSIEAVEENVDRQSVHQQIRREGIKHVPSGARTNATATRRSSRKREERRRRQHPRRLRLDAGEKRELVERTFTPLDWYLTGKYDNAEFVYIAHDADAWQVEREDFFGIRSGGGTKISSAYELAAELLEEYPWSDWNRYVFAAGDSENSSNDTEERVIPMMEEIDANLHAYVETQPSGNAINATHAEELERHFGTDSDDVAVAYVNGESDVTDAIYRILSTEGDDDE